MTTWDMMFRALPGIPLIQPGDSLPAIIAAAASEDGLTLADGDVLVVAQKIVSEAEGRIVRLADVTASERAQNLARLTGRDARLCQLYLDESKAITGIKSRHVVTIHRLGFEGTGAGVDMSNVGERSDGYGSCCPKTPTPRRAASATASANWPAPRSRSSSLTLSAARCVMARTARRSASPESGT